MPEDREEKTASPRRGSVTYVAYGRARPASITIDFDAEALRTARQTVPFRDVEMIDVRTNIVAVSDGEHWICFDALRYGSRRDGERRVQDLVERDGSLAPAFSQDLYDLRDAVERARRVAEERTSLDDRVSAASTHPPRSRRFAFTSIVRIDYNSIVLALLGIGIFWYFYQDAFQGAFEPTVLWYFFGALAAAVVLLYVSRGVYRATFDEAGVRVRRLWGTRFMSWNDVVGMRQQGLELEIEGRRRRLSFNLDLLRTVDAPILVRRGIRPTITPLGVHLLEWIRGKAPELPEMSVFGSRGERIVARVWILALAAANGVMFWLSTPQPFSRIKFRDNLIELGARTSDSFDEPWRFFTALFLHGDILHLTVNMLVLASVMGWIIRIFGVLRGTIIYVASGILGNVFAHFGLLARLMGDVPAPLSVGASTSLMGIVGALLGGVYRRPLSVPLAVRGRFRWAIPVFVAITMGSGLSIQFIDNDSHLGGFLAGFALAWIIPPKKPRVTARGAAAGGVQGAPVTT